MTATARTFEDLPGVRSHTPLLIGLVGPSFSGKTFSALRLATGIQKISGGDIFFVDTESKRALHYADKFKFRHVPFTAPFGSLDYRDAIKYCVSKGAGVVVIDSMTHEHVGEGGYLMTQEAELDRMAGDDAAKRERAKIASWVKPSKLRQQFVTGLLQLNSNFIFCFRAKEKIKPIPGRPPLEMGFMAIAGEELIFEMTVNCLLLPQAGGVPTWRSDHIGEKLMMKCPADFESMFASGKPLDEVTGRGLAEWARGNVGETKPQLTGSTTTTPVMTQLIQPAPPPALADLLEEGCASAEAGMGTLRDFWESLSATEKAYVGGVDQLESWKRTAKDAEAMVPAAEHGEVK